MAETSFIIDNGRRLYLKDATARKSIGSCSNLKTETKHCLVDAINEVCQKVENGGGGGGDYLPLSGGTMTGRLTCPDARFTGVIRNGIALNVADVKCTGLADETVIKTKIPYTTGGYYMPHIHITGYALNGGGLIDISVGIYPYNGSIGSLSAVSRCAWKPTIKASTYTENGIEYVAVSLIGARNYFGLKVDYGDVIQLTDACYGWKVEFNNSATSGQSIVPTEKMVEVPYESVGGASLEAVYPVGSIYLSVLATNPADLFGFGTWVQIKDKFLLSAGDTYAAGSEGGAEKHNHKYGYQYGAYYAEQSMENNANSGLLDYDADGNATVVVGSTAVTTNGPVNGSTSTASKSVAMNHIRIEANTTKESNMPPYLAVYVWQRTA